MSNTPTHYGEYIKQGFLIVVILGVTLFGIKSCRKYQKKKQELILAMKDFQREIKDPFLDKKNLDQFEAWAVENRYLTLDIEHVWKLTLNDGALDQLALIEVCGDLLNVLSAGRTGPLVALSKRAET